MQSIATHMERFRFPRVKKRWVSKVPPSKLPEIQKIAKDLREMISKEMPGAVEYECLDGTATGYSVWNEERVAAQRCFVPAGCTFTTHTHEAAEWVIVYEGEFEIDADGFKKTIGVGDGVYFRPGQPHSFKAIVDSWVMGVTVPHGEGYPDAGQPADNDDAR